MHFTIILSTISSIIQQAIRNLWLKIVTWLLQEEFTNFTFKMHSFLAFFPFFRFFFFLCEIKALLPSKLLPIKKKDAPEIAVVFEYTEWCYSASLSGRVPPHI